MNRCHMPSTLIKATLTEDFLAVCSVSNIVRVPVCVGKRTDERFGVPYGTGSDFGNFMQNVLAPTTGLSLDGSLFNPARAAGTWHYSDASQSCTDDQFVAMLNAYRGSGGLAREENLLALSSRRCGLDADTLANWIAEREAIGFEWQSRIWLPIVEFNLFDMPRPPALGQVLAELIPVYDPWELANWFAQPNPRLADRGPADALEHDPSAVLHGCACGSFHCQQLSPYPRLVRGRKNQMSCANAIFHLKESSHPPEVVELWRHHRSTCLFSTVRSEGQTKTICFA